MPCSHYVLSHSWFTTCLLVFASSVAKNIEIALVTSLVDDTNYYFPNSFCQNVNDIAKP